MQPYKVLCMPNDASEEEVTCLFGVFPVSGQRVELKVGGKRSTYVIDRIQLTNFADSELIHGYDFVAKITASRA